MSGGAAAAARTIHPGYQARELNGEGGGADDGNDASESSHNWFLQIKLLFYVDYKSNKRSCQEEIEQNF